MKQILLIFTITLFSFYSVAQQSELLLKYRNMALEYNHDIKAAQENIAASLEMIGAAKSDLKPKISADVIYRFTGNPKELNLNNASLGSPIHFQSPYNQYNASISLFQPIYSGGKLLASLKKAELQNIYDVNQSDMIKNMVSEQTDITYWNAVANAEIVNIATESKKSVEELTKIVRQRVEFGFSDPNDLLMAEVKLNETEYFLQQVKTIFSTSIMSLNSLIGLSLNNNTEVDKEVSAINSDEWIKSIIPNTTPEQLMAISQIKIFENDKKLIRSKYIPNLNVAIEGSIQRPGYDFTPQFKPNYGVFAQLSIPIFEWNKRGREINAAQHRENMANQNFEKVNDQVNLEISIAKLNLLQSVDQVNLTENSLNIAFENERRSLERYSEGKLSILEVLQSQLYRQTAQLNYVQAKLAAQNSWSRLQKATNNFQ